VFATAQLYDSAAVTWLDSLLSSPATPPTVATEAARAFGLIRTTESRAALARYLSSAPTNARTAPTVGEALRTMGRSARGDLVPVLRWTPSRDTELRWRAPWAVFRPRDPAAVPHLLTLANDGDILVRNWAVRGLTWAMVDSSGVDAAPVRARLRAPMRDGDRTVRTEALRALATHPDSESVMFVARALESDDAWLSVSAAELLGTQRAFAPATVPLLTAAVTRGGSCWRRTVALASIRTLASTDAVAPATALARDTTTLCRSVAQQTLTALSDTGAGRGGGRGAGGGRGRGGGGVGRGRGEIATGKTDADYPRIVEQWIVPDYEGRARPRAEWTTPRGTIEIELYPGDAPIATDWFVRAVNEGTIVGTDFSRVVPDFVDQQRGIMGAPVFRDEVNRHRLTRANVSWASAGLDTGRPGYTLNHTPQPHNEGSFTSLGRVVRGMDVVDRIELGDRVLGTRMLDGVR
jgi:cyclophilin family peptidyl-prolyl cis-trans isomerase